MLSFAMLSVSMMGVVIVSVNVYMLIFVILGVVMLSIIRLSVVKLSFIVANVLAPEKCNQLTHAKNILLKIAFHFKIWLQNLTRKRNLMPEKKFYNVGVRDEFMRWVYGGGVVLPGLVARREAEADLYFS